MPTDYQFVENPAEKRFEFHIDGEIAIMEYILAKEKIFLTHTEVPKALGGRGIGSRFVELVLKEVEKRELTLVPMCPFVAAYIKRHPEWQKLVLKGINIR